MSENKLRTEFVTVGKLLQYKTLTIPVYQRPYKWSPKNVNQLLDDIDFYKDKTSYRLGTIVIHEDEHGMLNIVDGQQRTITLILLARAILFEKGNNVKDQELKRLLENLNKNVIDPEFNNDISITNIQNNYREIERRVAVMDEDTIIFIFNRCEFIQFILNDITEAFQFFDSQNARGKDLEPHDLLKAFHLREFSETDEGVKSKIVNAWESIRTNELANLFGEYLFRIKGWSKGNSSRYFAKEDVDLFKGINIEKIKNYPYTELLRIAHFYVDRYNNSFERKIDQNHSSYPFQIDQTIINGRRFFEMISHYKNVLDSLAGNILTKIHLEETALLIYSTINSYEAKNRTGDGYVRTLFDCTLIYYLDKFGNRDISKAFEKIFIWAYSLRLKYQALQLASVDNYVLEELNLFKIIRDANEPSEVLTVYLKPIEKVNSTKTTEIVNLFKKLRYYDK